ncbi:MAG: hypothetical protein HY921_03665 [Elusimicrobia bacterium]|nr:hypothetical protein [Elusimicrobiota bacterium]
MSGERRLSLAAFCCLVPALAGANNKMTPVEGRVPTLAPALSRPSFTGEPVLGSPVKAPPAPRGLEIAAASMAEAHPRGLDILKRTLSREGLRLTPNEERALASFELRARALGASSPEAEASLELALKTLRLERFMPGGSQADPVSAKRLIIAFYKAGLARHAGGTILHEARKADGNLKYIRQNDPDSANGEVDPELLGEPAAILSEKPNSRILLFPAPPGSRPFLGSVLQAIDKFLPEAQDPLVKYLLLRTASSPEEKALRDHYFPQLKKEIAYSVSPYELSLQRRLDMEQVDHAGDHLFAAELFSLKPGPSAAQVRDPRISNFYRGLPRSDKKEIIRGMVHAQVIPSEKNLRKDPGIRRAVRQAWNWTELPLHEVHAKIAALKSNGQGPESTPRVETSRRGRPKSHLVIASMPTQRALNRRIVSLSAAASSKNHPLLLAASREGEPEAFRRLFITAADVENVSRLLDPELRARRRPEIAFRYYLEARLRRHSWLFRKMARRFIESRLEWLDPEMILTAETTFLKKSGLKKLFAWALRFLFPREILGIWVHPEGKGGVMYYAALAHELEHFIQLNDRSYRWRNGVDIDRHRYHMEFGATTAEHEFFKLVPEALLRWEEDLWSGLPNLPGRDSILKRIRAAKKGLEDFRSTPPVMPRLKKPKRST